MSTELLTTAEAAERLGLTMRAVQKMIEVGRLEARKVGRDYLIHPAALENIPRLATGRPPKSVQPGDIEMHTKTTRRLSQSIKQDAEKTMGKEKKDGEK